MLRRPKGIVAVAIHRRRTISMIARVIAALAHPAVAAPLVVAAAAPAVVVVAAVDAVLDIAALRVLTARRSVRAMRSVEAHLEACLEECPVGSFQSPTLIFG